MIFGSPLLNGASHLHFYKPNVQLLFAAPHSGECLEPGPPEGRPVPKDTSVPRKDGRLGTSTVVRPIHENLERWCTLLGYRCPVFSAFIVNRPGFNQGNRP